MPKYDPKRLIPHSFWSVFFRDGYFEKLNPQRLRLALKWASPQAKRLNILLSKWFHSISILSISSFYKNHLIFLNQYGLLDYKVFHNRKYKKWGYSNFRFYYWHYSLSSLVHIHNHNPKIFMICWKSHQMPIAIKSKRPLGNYLSNIILIGMQEIKMFKKGSYKSKGLMRP